MIRPVDKNNIGIGTNSETTPVTALPNGIMHVQSIPNKEVTLPKISFGVYVIIYVESGDCAACIVKPMRKNPIAAKIIGDILKMLTFPGILKRQ